MSATHDVDDIDMETVEGQTWAFALISLLILLVLMLWYCCRGRNFLQMCYNMMPSYTHYVPLSVQRNRYYPSYGPPPSTEHHNHFHFNGSQWGTNGQAPPPQAAVAEPPPPADKQINASIGSLHRMA